MTHTPSTRRLALSALTLAATLSLTLLEFDTAAAQQKSAPQTKRAEKAKPGDNLLPNAPPQTAQKPVATQLPPSILVRWQGRPGVNRYRLQLATDAKFEDVVFDQAVEGRQYVVK